MKKVGIPLFWIITGIASILYAGDIGNFVNLGFSPDSTYFMFGQYGIEEKASTAYADLFTVHVPRNRFTEGGVKTEKYPVILQPGQDGSGALYTILTRNVELTKKHDIRHLDQGRFLYILVNGRTPESQLEFRDFVTGTGYRVNLIQSSQGSGKDIKSSFYIQLSVIPKEGKIRPFTVGLPSFLREGVRQYRIRQILLSPDEKSLVFVVEKETVDETGINIRYMVETVSIQ